MVANNESHFEYRGVRIDDINLTDISKRVFAMADRKGYVCFNDITNIIRAVNDPGMFTAINESIISAPDGMPLVWFGRLVGGKKIDRVTGYACLSHFLEEDNGLKHFLLGDTDETIKRVIKKARHRNGNLQISGYSPPFKDTFDDKDNEVMIERINKFSPDIVWVSFGGGKQEKWMYENYLKINSGIMMGVGAGFKFYLGDLVVPPLIIQKMGLHWFFRMLNDPGFWIRNQFSSKMKFFWHAPFEILRERIKGRLN